MVYIYNVIDQKTPKMILSGKEKDHPSNVIADGLLNFNILIREKNKSHSHHTNTSQPGKDELEMVCIAAGNHAKFTTTILKYLIKLIDLNHFITSRTIRELLQRALPKKKCISSDDVANVREIVKLLISKGKSINTFQYNADTALGLIRFLDYVSSDIIDNAIQCSKEISKIIFMIPTTNLAVLNKLGTNDPGLIYNFCMNNEKNNWLYFHCLSFDI